jgi:hypothetical protein
LTSFGWLLLVIGYLGPAQAEDAAIVIRAGHLVDTELGRMAGPQMILVRDGRNPDPQQQSCWARIHARGVGSGCG